MFQTETKFTRYKCSLVHSPVACHLNASFRKCFSISSVVVALLVVITESVQALPRQQWRDDYYVHHRHGCETWNSETNANQKGGKVWLSFSLISFLSSYRRHLLSWCHTDPSFITIAYLWPWTSLTRQLRHESAIFTVFSHPALATSLPPPYSSIYHDCSDCGFSKQNPPSFMTLHSKRT